MALAGGSLAEDAGPALLSNDCVGCHSSLTNKTIIEMNGSSVPIVYNSVEPTFPLAGGNFYWVSKSGNDDKGHNVAGITLPDNNLDKAPGQIEGTLESCAPCHKSLTKGCEGCHRIPKHHANDDTTLVNTAEQGWYRFLSGHRSGEGMGVKGIEHEKWNYNANAGSHNEYLGNIKSEGKGFGDLGYTTTAFCTGCHGKFHTEQKNENGQWIRHPSDAVICDPYKPDSKNSEYAVAFYGVYDPDVPVARPSLVGWTTSSDIVTPEKDMVMCLSCHVAHGSPYPDMLRWDYDDMIAGGGGTDGCFKCHTDKN